MNPRTTYNSLKSSSSLTKSLFLLLGLQFALLTISNLSLNLPKFISNHISELIFSDKGLNIEHDYLKISPTGEVNFSNLKIILPGRYAIHLKYGKLKFNLNRIVKRNESWIKGLLIEDATIDLKKTSFHDVKLEHLQFLSKRDNSVYVDLSSTIMGKSINGKGLLKLNIFDKKTTSEKINLSSFINYIDKGIQNHSKNLSNTYAENIDVKLADNEFSEFFLKINSVTKQKKDTKFHLKDLSLNVSLDRTLMKVKANAQLNTFTTSFGAQRVSVNNIKAKYSSNESNLSNAWITCGKSELSGKVKGYFEPFFLNYNVDLNQSSLLFIASNKSMESCVNFKIRKKRKCLEGFLNLKPNHFSLKFLKDEDYLEILSGESLNLSFGGNLAPTTPNFETLFSINARNFAAFESPTGNYDFFGEVNTDLSIQIRNAFGVMGRSEVLGSYSQSWNPHAYEFRLSGNCHPNDINNWLGRWWRKIWKDFSFPDKIPYGNFKISGVWGGEAGNSKTFGIVDAGKLNYKEFKTENSNITVQVDANATQIYGKNIIHNKGTLSGILAFPRKHLNSPVFLSYSVDGHYPLNDARTIFGQTFEKVIKDINATNLLCSATGEILNQTEGINAESNFNLNIQSISPLTIKGFEVKELHGNVVKKSSFIEGKFPKFKIAEGMGQLNFEMETNASEELVKLNFSLKDANKRLLFKDIIRARKHGFVNKFSTEEEGLNNVEDLSSTEGIVSLTIQAGGPLSNPLHFEGTGMIQLKESKLGQINLFGKISESLSNLKIPMPSTAFSFNELTIPFVLNNETMSFDNLILTGPLSKIKAQGHFNLSSGTIDLIARLSLVGNIPIPIIKNLIQLVDPLSKVAEIKMTGNYQNPRWELLLSNN